MKIFLACFVLLVCAVLQTIASATEFTDNLCLNGARDPAGKCVCHPGYAEFRGNCFLSIAPAVVKQESGTPIRVNRACPVGYTNQQGTCVMKTCTGTLCDSSCPPGYVLNAGYCEIPNAQCPPGTRYQNGFCYYQPVPPTLQTVAPLERVEVVPPLRIDIPIPELPLDPKDEEEDDEDDDIEVVPNPQPQPIPGVNVVHNNNIVNYPSNVSTHNVNNVYIHITRVKPSGAIKTVVIRNNETTVYEEQPPSKKQDPEEVTTLAPEGETETESETEKCCIVVSPRICRKQQEDEWVCFHRKSYRCGDFCTANIVYLKPRRPSYQNSVLVMPPTMIYPSFLRYGVCRWGVCPRVDCSGCSTGAYRCHTYCYTYDCDGQEGCNYINQDDFCNDTEDELCTVNRQDQ